MNVRQHVGDDRGIIDPASVAELRAEDRAAEILAPGVVEGGDGHPSGKKAVLRKRFGPPERQAQVRAQPLEVAPHVAALGGIEIERRRGPALVLEDRSEQEGAKAHLDTGLLGQRANAHGRRVGVGRGEIEPEIEHRIDHGVMLTSWPEM